MIKAFRKLNIYHKCAVLSGFFVCILSLCLIPLFFIDLGDVVWGLLLGCGFGILSYFVTGLLENKHAEHYKWAIFVAIFRFLLFAILLILLALCYYKWDIKIFNIFSFVGGYFICLVVLIILFIIKDKKEKA